MEDDSSWTTVDKAILDDTDDVPENLEKLIGFEGRPDPSSGKWSSILLVSVFFVEYTNTLLQCINLTHGYVGKGYYCVYNEGRLVNDSDDARPSSKKLK